MRIKNAFKSVGSVLSSSPFIVLWNITEKCNLRCKFCDIDKGKNHMSKEECLEAVSNMNSLGITSINFDGGEPLVRTDLEEIVEHCLDIGMFVTVSTNGTLVTEERAEKLVKLFDQICVSVDGLEKTHDYFRGNGAFKKAVKGLKLLIENNNKNGKSLIGTNAVISKTNVNEMLELFNFMKSLGTDYFALCPINDPYPLNIDKPTISKETYPDEKEYKKLVSDFLKIKKEQGNSIILSEKYIKFFEKHFSSGVKVCDIGKYYLFIDSSGNVCPCVRFRKPLFNILDKEMVEKYRKNRRMFDSELEKIKNVCPGCILGCTTEISIRCRFPGIVFENLKSLPYFVKGLVH